MAIPATAALRPAALSLVALSLVSLAAPLSSCSDDPATGGDDGTTAAGDAGDTAATDSDTAGSDGDGDTASSDGDAGASGGDAVVVSSAGGLATLTVPAGGLPAGVTEADLAVTELAPADVDFTGAELLAAYDLGPDGAVFASPVTLTVRLPATEEGVTFLHADAEATEVPEFRVVAADDSEVTYEVTLHHFSRVAAVARASFRMSVTLRTPEAFVGGLILSEFTLDLLVSEGELTHGTDEWTEIITFSGLENGGWEGMASGEIEDEEVRAMFQRGVTGIRLASDGTNVRVATPPFVCRVPGSDDITWSVDAYHPTTRARVYTDGRRTEEVSETRVGYYSSQRDARCIAPTSDDRDSYIDSLSGETPGYQSGEIDAVSYGARTQDVDQAEADLLKNTSIFECGDDGATSGMRVVCPEFVVPLGAGQLLVATLNLAEVVPEAHPTRSFIYSLVLDSDGDPANDWRFVEPYDWDLFQGADRWYQLIWDHRAARWSLTVTQVHDDQTIETVASGAWAVIRDEHINFYVPGAEYAPDKAAWRMTTFGHDGDFTAGDRGADVTGDDPTEPLIPLQ